MNFPKNHVKFIAGVAFGLALAGGGLFAATGSNNYIGAVFLSDATTPTNQAAIGADGSLLVRAGSQSALTLTDRGGTVTSGATAQQLAAANTARKYFLIQNPCTATTQGIATAENLTISVTGTATTSGANSYELGPCGSVSLAVNGTVITSAVSVMGATTSHRWYAQEGQ